MTNNNLELTGRIVRIFNEVNGTSARGQWAKQEFLVETMEQYPRKVYMSVWGDKILQLKSFKEGDEVRVAFNLESREYNERWYTDIRAWKITASSGGGSSQPQGGYNAAPENSGYSDAPANNNAADTTAVADENDDLPF